KSPMRKAFVLTAARYSRAATTIILRMSAPYCGSRGGIISRGPRNPHKDVVQRRASQLEVRDASAPHQLGKQFLRIGTGCHAQLLKSAEVIHLFNARECSRIKAVAFHSYTHRVLPKAILDRIESSIQNLVALVNHENVIAHFLGDRHVVGR